MSFLDLDNFDPSVRPQDDLFRHVNGHWLETTDIPADKPGWGAFTKLRDDSDEAIRTIVTSLTAGEPGSERRQVADLYASFMDEEAVEARGGAPLVPLLAKVDEISDVPTLMRTVGWLTRRGLAGLIGLGTEADPGDPHRYLMFVGQGGLGLPDEAYYREDQHAAIREAYAAHVERLLTLAGVDQAADQARRVLALETEIARCHWDIVRCRDLQQMYNPMTSHQLGESAPGLAWDAFREGLEVAPEQLADLVAMQPDFFTGLQDLLIPERLDDWRAWTRWHIVAPLAMSLAKAFVDERFGFVGTTLVGTPELKPRWKRGVDLVQDALGEAVGKIYVERFFSPVAKERMDTLVANLLRAYRDSITQLDWMTDETLQQALHKLDKFRPKIGYPVRWRDYSALRITPDDLIANRLAIASFQFDFEVDRAGGPIDPDEWLMFPQTVNAYYHPLRNEIVFPAAILRPPFFDEDADDAVNYGGIGAVIGHEIGHGFDDQGSTCDGDGYLRDWWTAADRAAFEERTAALVAQYDGLHPHDAPDASVNGRLTLGENIGDLGGLSIAYKAWRLATRGVEPEPIDGYTGTQRLFLSWGTIWQSKNRAEYLRTRVAVDPHSPDEFRCNVVVGNVPEFYEAFGVVESDALYVAPEERVKIW